MTSISPINLRQTNDQLTDASQLNSQIERTKLIKSEHLRLHHAQPHFLLSSVERSRSSISSILAVIQNYRFVWTERGVYKMDSSWNDKQNILYAGRILSFEPACGEWRNAEESKNAAGLTLSLTHTRTCCLHPARCPAQFHRPELPCCTKLCGGGHLGSQLSSCGSRAVRINASKVLILSRLFKPSASCGGWDCWLRASEAVAAPQGLQPLPEWSMPHEPCWTRYGY